MAEHFDMSFESLLRSTLKAEAASLPVAIGPEDVLRRRGVQRRRRFGWLTDPRPRSRDRGLRLATVLGVLALAAVVGVAALLGGRPAVIPGASPSPSPSPSPRAIPDTGGHMHLELEPGAWYADQGFPFRIELSLPELPSGRWEGQVIRPAVKDERYDQPYISIHTDTSELDIALLEAVFVDRCPVNGVPRSPIRAANDLVVWLAGLADGEGAKPTALEVGDRRGWQLGELLGPCRETGEPGVKSYEINGPGPFWLPPDAATTVTLVRVDGAVVAIRATVDPAREVEEGPALAAILSSIRFGLSLEDGPAPTPENPWPGRTLEPGVTPRHSPGEVEAKVMTVIQRSEQILGRLAEPRVRVMLVPPDSTYLVYQTDGSPAGGIGSGDELLWVAEFEGTYAHATRREGALACTAGILAYTDEALELGSSGCRDANLRRLESPPPPS